MQLIRADAQRPFSRCDAAVKRARWTSLSDRRSTAT